MNGCSRSNGFSFERADSRRDPAKSEVLVDGILVRRPNDAEMLLVKSNLLASAGKPEEAFQQGQARGAEAALMSRPRSSRSGKLLCLRGDTGRQARI